MMPRKYTDGPLIETLDALAYEVANGRYVLVRGKPMHPRWMDCMQLRALRRMIDHQSITIAINLEQPKEIL